MTINLNTIFNFPVEIDFQVRSFLCEELCTTSSVCKGWEILNRQIAEILLKKAFPLFPIYRKFSFNNQYCFLKKLSGIGDFPKEITKIIGEFYQFKKLPFFRLSNISSITAKDMKFPIMVGVDSWNNPFAMFKLRYPKVFEYIASISNYEKQLAKSNKWEQVLVCSFNQCGKWMLEIYMPLPELKEKLTAIGFTKDEYTHSPAFYYYDDNIEKLESIANETLENVDLKIPAENN